MVKLVWKVPGQAPLAFPIRQERVSIGRDAGNDLRLPEPAVSSRHATIISRSGRVVLHDLKSSNGTWVNGARIDNQELVHGDMVAFGRVVMHFIDEAQETPPPPSRPVTPPGAPKRVVSPPTTIAPDRTIPPPSPPAVAPTPALDATLPPLVAMSLPPATADLSRTVPRIDEDMPRLPEFLPDATLPRPVQIADTSQPDLQELDRLLGSIRSFRSQEVDVVQQKQQEMLREWRATLSYAEAMKARLAAETRIRFFDVSERRHEIVLRIVRAPGEPTRLLSLTWGHPDQRDKAPDGIWMRATHHPDRRFYKSAEAVRELVAMLALFLA